MARERASGRRGRSNGESSSKRIAKGQKSGWVKPDGTPLRKRKGEFFPDGEINKRKPAQRSKFLKRQAASDDRFRGENESRPRTERTLSEKESRENHASRSGFREDRKSGKSFRENENERRSERSESSYSDFKRRGKREDSSTKRNIYHKDASGSPRERNDSRTPRDRDEFRAPRDRYESGTPRTGNDRDNDRSLSKPRRENSYRDREKPFEKKRERYADRDHSKEIRGRFDKRSDRGDFKKSGGSDFKKRDHFNKGKSTGFQRTQDGAVRLNKYIANAGICSRREADELIEAGVISVNGVIVTELGTKVMPGDEVKYHEQKLRTEKLVYVLLNKPKDYITTTDDPEERKTVMNLVRDAGRERLFPVGRLDRNTTGLLIITNDGDLTKKLTHPSSNIAKIYQVELDRNISHEDMVRATEGVELEDGPANVDEIHYASTDAKNVIGVELHSGRNRVVRRIFESMDYKVVKLDRTSFAGLTKKDLPRGRWRFLTEMEVNMLKMLTGKKKN